MYRVLIVEDEMLVRLGVKALIDCYNNELAPDILITDIMMPQMDGFDLISVC